MANEAGYRTKINGEEFNVYFGEDEILANKFKGSTSYHSGLKTTIASLDSEHSSTVLPGYKYIGQTIYCGPKPYWQVKNCLCSSVMLQNETPDHRPDKPAFWSDLQPNNVADVYRKEGDLENPAINIRFWELPRISNTNVTGYFSTNSSLNRSFGSSAGGSSLTPSWRKYWYTIGGGGAYGYTGQLTVDGKIIGQPSTNYVSWVKYSCNKTIDVTSTSDNYIEFDVPGDFTVANEKSVGGDIIYNSGDANHVDAWKSTTIDGETYFWKKMFRGTRNDNTDVCAFLSNSTDGTYIKKITVVGNSSADDPTKRVRVEFADSIQYTTVFNLREIWLILSRDNYNVTAVENN